MKKELLLTAGVLLAQHTDIVRRANLLPEDTTLATVIRKAIHTHTLTSMLYGERVRSRSRTRQFNASEAEK